jgi:alkylation response protein AidB-like acyl-CoA dehydrogenase
VNELLEDLREGIRDYVAKEAPMEAVGSWEREKTYPSQFFDRLAELGYLAVHLPEDVGGAGLGARAMAVMGEELGRAGLELSVSYGLTAFPSLNLCRHGSAGQIGRYLPDVIQHRRRFAVGMSEPEAGSDVAAVRSSARRTAGGWTVSGQKLWISGAGVPHTTLHALVRTDAGESRHRGLSVLLIPLDADGIALRRIPTIGRHILGTYEIFLDNVFVPDDDVLGPVGAGWQAIASNLEMERAFAAAQLAGCARTALDLTIGYVRQRRQFGRTLSSFQVIAHDLAQLHARLEAARLLAYHAADAIDAGRPAAADAAAAKLLTSEIFQDITQAGMQFMGGYGYTTEFPMERLWREARSTTISAGTSQIQRSIIAKSLGLGGRG